MKKQKGEAITAVIGGLTMLAGIGFTGQQFLNSLDQPLPACWDKPDVVIDKGGYKVEVSACSVEK